MADDALIPPEARARLGERLGEPTSGEVLRKETERYAYAVGDDNRLYFDDAYARAAGYEGSIAPPLFFEIPMRQAVPLSELRPDGIARARQAPIPLKVERVMAGGQEVEFVQPIYPGDTLTAETRLVDLQQKQGRSGPLVLIVRETVYTNQHGEVVVRSRSTGLVR